MSQISQYQLCRIRNRGKKRFYNEQQYKSWKKFSWISWMDTCQTNYVHSIKLSTIWSSFLTLNKLNYNFMTFHEPIFSSYLSFFPRIKCTSLLIERLSLTLSLDTLKALLPYTFQTTHQSGPHLPKKTYSIYKKNNSLNWKKESNTRKKRIRYPIEQRKLEQLSYYSLDDFSPSSFFPLFLKYRHQKEKTNNPFPVNKITWLHPHCQVSKSPVVLSFSPLVSLLLKQISANQILLLSSA